MRFRASLSALLTVGAVTGSVAAVALAATGDDPVVLKEAAGDTAPDLVRAELRRTADGRLRASIDLAHSVTAKSLLPKSGIPGSICLRIYTVATAGVLPPDYLVCATPDAKGQKLKASVMAEQVNELPKRVGTATVTRATNRSVVMRFSQSSIGKPAVITFAAEATRAGCARLSCVDTLPDAPKTAKLVLHEGSSG